MVYYEEVFRALEKKGVKYAVVGGVALTLHGIVRFTADLDLLIQMDPDNIERFLSVMDELGYRPRIPVPASDFADPQKRAQWREEKGMEVFTFFHPDQPMKSVDVFIFEPFDFSEVDGEKQTSSAKGISIPFISKRHLKAMKQGSGRPRDLADIAALNELERMEGES